MHGRVAVRIPEAYSWTMRVAGIVVVACLVPLIAAADELFCELDASP